MLITTFSPRLVRETTLQILKLKLELLNDIDILQGRSYK